MNTTKQLIAAAVFAVAGSAAFAGSTGDITSVNDTFVPMTSRADVKSDVLAAHAMGVTQFVTEADSNAGATASFRSSVTRDAVRAQARDALHSTRSVQEQLDSPAA